MGTIYILVETVWFGDDADNQVIGAYSNEENFAKAKEAVVAKHGSFMERNLHLKKLSIDINPVTSKPL
jgi:hypothetical protein